MADGRIVVIGASAGGVEALLELASSLPDDFAAPVIAVVHISPSAPSMLPDLLSRKGNLPAKHAVDGERYKPGLIYLAPPDHHVLINDGHLRVIRGPRENRHRPAVDPLFRSAAVAGGPRTIGVILTGSLDDGTAGLVAIKRRGGVAIVQDPAEAMHPSMPQHAMESVDVDFVLPLHEISSKLADLSKEPAPRAPAAASGVMDMEDKISAMEDEGTEKRPGTPSAYSCPDCGGVLWEIKEGDSMHYRCRVGHAFSPESMLGAQDDLLEQALWTALKTLEESAALSKKLAAIESARGHHWMADRFAEREHDALEHAGVIRRVIATSKNDVAEVTDAEAQATRQRG